MCTAHQYCLAPFKTKYQRTARVAGRLTHFQASFFVQPNTPPRYRGMTLARASTVETTGIFQEIVPSLAPRALVIIGMISQDPAVVVMVEEVGVMVDAGAVDAVAVQRRQMVVPQLQYLRLRLQHLPQAPQTRPCRGVQFL